MSNALTTAARPLVMDPTAKAVLMALCDMAREPDAPDRPCEAWPPLHGQDGAIGLCDWTCLSERPVQLAIKRLVAEGFIARRQLRHGVVYTILLLTPVVTTPAVPTPVATTPVVETATPVAATPKALRSITKRKETSSLPSTRAASAKSVVACALDLAALPSGASDQQWADYVEMRVTMSRADKKRPWTATVARKAIEKLHALAAAGNDPGAVLDQSVLNLWQGLFPVKDDRNGRSGRPGADAVAGPRRGYAADMLAAAHARPADDSEGDPRDRGGTQGEIPAWLRRRS